MKAVLCIIATHLEDLDAKNGRLGFSLQHLFLHHFNINAAAAGLLLGCSRCCKLGLVQWGMHPHSE
jgi:hypothetical protein